MSKGKKILLIIVVLLLIGGSFAGGYYLRENMKSKCKVSTEPAKEENKQEEKQEEQQKEEPKKEEQPEKTTEPSNEEINQLRLTIQEVYEKAYGELYYQFFGEGKTEIEMDVYGRKEKVTEVDPTKLSEYFTKDRLERLLLMYSSYNKDGKYYIGSDLPRHDSFDPGTIFGATDAGKRTLTILTKTDTMIFAQAEKAETSWSTFGGEYITFKKENGSWKIDMYE